MNRYLVTFYTHFGAASFKEIWETAGMKAALKPVPRALSASCGVCIAFESAREAGEIVAAVSALAEDTDAEFLCLEKDGGYEKLFSAEHPEIKASCAGTCHDMK